MASTLQKRAAARRLATELFNKQGRASTTADLNLDDLVAAIESFDVAMDTVISTIPALWQPKTIKIALIDNLPEPFKSKSTATQKVAAMGLWMLAEVGEA